MKNKNISIIVGVSALFLLVLSGVTAYLLPHLPLVWQLCVGLGVAGLVAYAVLEKESLKQLFSKRTTQYGLNSAFMSIVALVIAVVLNLIANEHDVKKDLTKNKVHTLSEQSVKILKAMKTEVRLRTFANPDQVQNFTKIFDKYTYHTNMIKPEFVDVDKEPTAVTKYKIKQAGTIVVESEARTVNVDNIYGPDDPKVEEKLTNAIIQVAKGDKKKIYFLSGHGERLPSDTGKEGYSEMKDALENGRYKVEDLVLLDKEKVPADAEIIIIPAAKSEFMEHELKMLDSYVRLGGKMMIMLEPDSSANLKPFLEKFGLDWKRGDTILETNPLQRMAGGNPLTPIVMTYDATHQITQEAKQPTIYPVPTPIEKMAVLPAGVTVSPLFSTSNKSFQVNMKSLEGMKGGRIELDEKKNRKGPIGLAFAVTGKVDKKAEPFPTSLKDADAKEKEKLAENKPEKDPEFRMIVVGDSDFAGNSARRFGINADLFQNMLSWLAHEEDLIAVRPKAADSSEFNITEERAKVITLASVFFAPFGMFLAGIAVWFSRKRK